MKPKIKSLIQLPLAAIVVSFAGVHQSAQAATDVWDGLDSGIWDTTTTNWNFGGLFTSGNDALFTGTPFNNVTSAAGQTIGAITLDSTFTGSVALTGANTVAGPTTINAGLLSIAANDNLGASAITLDGGTFKAALGTAAITNTHPITVGASGGTIHIGTPTSGTPTFILGSAGNLTGGGNLTVIGDGPLGTTGGGWNVLVMGNANAGYTGDVIIQDGGVIEYANAEGIASGSFTIGNNGMLSANGANIARSVTLNSGAYLSFQNSNNGVFSGGITLNGGATVRTQDWWGAAVRSGLISGTITGAGSLTVNSGSGSGGILGLRGTNTFAGGVTIQSGGVVGVARDAGTNSNLGTGSVTVNTGGVLRPGYQVTSNANTSTTPNNITLDGGAIYVDDAHQHLSGAVDILASGILGSTYNSGANTAAEGDKGLALDGVVSGSGPLTVQHTRIGTGNNFHTSFVSFSNNSNTYSGTITVNENTIASEGGVYLGVNGSTALQHATIVTTAIPGANLRFGTSPIVFNTGLGSAMIGAIDGSGPLVLTGYNQTSHTYGGDPIALTVGGNGASTSISGVISGLGSLTKSGAGTLTLAESNTYSGDTKVNGGTLMLGADLSIQNSAFDTSGAGVMTLSGFNPSFGGLKGGSSLASVISNYSNVLELTLNPGAGATHTYSGGIVDGLPGMDLVKSGAGTQVLSGPNTYTGETWVNAGILRFATPASMSPSSAVTVADGATLAVNVGGAGEFATGSGNGTIGGLLAGLGGQAGSTVSYNSAAAFLGIDTSNAASAVTESGDISVADIGLMKLGTGTLVFSGNNSYTGKTTISAGTLQFNGAQSMSAASALELANGATLDLRADADTTFTPASFSNLTAGSTYNISVNGLTGAGIGKKLSIIAPAGGGGGNSNTTLNVGSTSDDTLEFTTAFQTNSNSGAAWTTLAQNIFNLTGANVILNGLTMGNNGDGGITVNSATGNSLTINGNVTTNSNRTTAGIVNSGTLTLNNTVSLAGPNQGFFVILNGGTLNVNNAGAIRTNAAPGGAGNRGGLTIAGGTLDNTSGAAKTLAFNPTVQINGDFAFSSGGSTSDNDLNLGTGQVHLGSTAGTTRTITANGSATLTLGGAVVDGTTANSIVKAGSGKLLLGGTNTYTGATTVNAGTLALENGSQSSPITVNNGAALGFTLGSGTTSTSTVTFGVGSTVKITGTPTLPSYTLMTASLFSGTPVLDAPIAGYSLSVTGGDTLVLASTTAGFGSWANSKGLDGSNNGATQDPNQNGIPNVLEYVLNGEPLLGESPALILPTLDASGSNFVFTFTRRVESADDTTQIFEYGTDLSGWTPLNITAPTDATVTLGTPTGGDPNVQTITVTVAKGTNTEMFGRLKVVK